MAFIPSKIELDNSVEAPSLFHQKLIHKCYISAPLLTF